MVLKRQKCSITNTQHFILTFPFTEYITLHFINIKYHEVKKNKIHFRRNSRIKCKGALSDISHRGVEFLRFQLKQQNAL